MRQPIRVAVIGAGSFACRYHIPNLLRRTDVELTAIVKRSEEKRQEVLDYFDIPRGYADYREMLTLEQPDAVVIATPHHLHYEQTKECLERGIPVLLEKPITIELSHAQELAALADHRNVPLLVAYNRRVDARYREAARIIADGGVGEVRYLEGRRFVDLEWLLSGDLPPSEDLLEKHWPESDRPNFRMEPKFMGPGFLDDGGTHMVDSVLWFAFSQPVKVNALMSYNTAGLEMRSAVNLSFANGALGSICCSADTPPVVPFETLIYGSEGAIALSKEEFIHVYKNQSMNPTPTFPLLTTTDHFINVLQGSEENLCTSEAAIQALAVIRAAFDSARTGQTVSLSY